jgi:hypothetical protein
MEKKPRSKNWLLIKFREYHTWLGLGAALFIVSTALTGIFLNHKDLIPGWEKKKPEMRQSAAALTPSTALDQLPVSFSQALTKSSVLLGPDAALEHIQLKDEHGTLIYKVKLMEHDHEKEVWVNAHTGDATLKDGYAMTTGAGSAEETQRTNWNKIINDIHTGKIAGTAGKLVIDLCAIILAALTISGIYLWWIPKLRKKQSQRQAAAKAAAVAA